MREPSHEPDPEDLAFGADHHAYDSLTRRSDGLVIIRASREGP